MKPRGRPRLYARPACHPRRPHFAAGLCRSCYNRNRRRMILAGTWRPAARGIARPRITDLSTPLVPRRREPPAPTFGPAGPTCRRCRSAWLKVEDGLVVCGLCGRVAGRAA